MSAKFLNVFTDENPELQKQIGCMTGLFQMFDGHHILAGRRLNGHNHKKLPSGIVLLNNSNLQTETTARSAQIVLEKNHSKNLNENRRVSIESSRTSFSSSSCSSSFSSLECNKSTQQEPSPFERSTFAEKSLKKLRVLQSSEIDTRPLRSSPCRDQQNPSTPSSRQSLDFRDVVKDSIYRDARGLSVKTSNKEEVRKHVMKHQDSPRPLPVSKLMDGSYLIGINGKPKISAADLNESLRVLAKFKEAPWHFSEDKEPPRSSYEAKEGCLFSVSKESPRFSYDGREIPRQSLDSRENIKCSTKLRELPRLSLDSRQGCTRSSNFDSKSNPILKDLERIDANQRTSRALILQQDLESRKRPPSVVAKLMGLEEIPNFSSSVQDQVGLTTRCTEKDSITFEGHKKNNFSSKSLKVPEESRQDRLSRSPKSSLKDSNNSPQSRTPDAVVKPISNSRLPVETAPWRQQGKKGHGMQKTAFGLREAHTRQQTESVYSEIERKLKELEFQHSNKDLRALKQILDAIQAKGLSETKKCEGRPSGVSVETNYSNQETTWPNQNLRSENKRSSQNVHPVSTLIKQANTTPRPLESPIVIMKPVKSVNRSYVPASSINHFDGLSGLRKVRTGDATDVKRVSVKDQTPKFNLREPGGQILLSSEKKSNKRAEENILKKTRLQGLSKPQQSTKEHSGNSAKSSGSLSPRLQQRRLELEKKSRPPVPSSDSTKPRRHSTNRHPSESVSPRGKLRPKPMQAQQIDDQLSEISSGTRNMSHQGDEISVRSDSNISLASQVDVEVTSADRSAELNSIFVHQGSLSPPDRAVNNTASILKQKKWLRGLSEDVSSAELATVTLEQPSPVSVLSFYRENDAPPSPVNKISNSFKDDEMAVNSRDIPGGEGWKTPESDLSSSMNHKKLESGENLLQKPRQPSLLLWDTQSHPDHQYVSEILMASGLVLEDLSAGPTGPMPTQLHQSGHPINPDLFLVLEQTKSGSLPKPEPVVCDNAIRSKPDPEKLRRKLVFDTVNEILVQKLDLAGPSPRPKTSLPGGKLTTRRTPSGQWLLTELCLEIERLQAGGSGGGSVDDDDDGLKSILSEDVVRRSEGWVDFGKEVSGLVLDIERSIFKDLIDEVVSGESAAKGSLVKPSRRRRQLFAK